MKEMTRIGKNAREAAIKLAVSGIEQRNEGLRQMAKALRAGEEAILLANDADIRDAKEAGKNAAFVERLTLSPARVEAMAAGLEEVVALEDPLGRVSGGWKRPNGLEIRRVSVPLGVIGIIYESRPNVTADAAALCLKSGNACVLRGGSDAIRSNLAIAQLLRGAIDRAGLPIDSVSILEDTSREAAVYLMRMHEYLDVLIPRGGASLIQNVMKNAKVPVIETGTGNCHVYVDQGCRDLKMAEEIIVNAKVSRPSVCNAAETLLVHSAVAKAFLPACIKRLQGLGVEIRGCQKTELLCPGIKRATQNDYYSEFGDLILAVRIVPDLDAAIAHVNQYGTKHSEAILTHDLSAAAKFQNAVDAAVVYVNASTRFTDGGEFGFGAEIGISNQKLHARGPMGLEQLTTIKYLVQGDGQIR
ncbi:MAG: glutamate-5-semialdehyde dehydrogenase [Christensenellaceae bacterium]|nr:glutamate-5-semialdehyde dehydrogenase [Christensenellaceae bacterium]